ncbi:hypothetical protein B1R32_12616 [Abditibacterium utsteinense]|uniref:Uncharacterized protein n=1 Tax=Abditibacterium utsteinense TaxID=1960156 RepID=A0A2S8SPA5_9BACT|nr:hypothetical protein [Abditibacterium utsteinense]PQV62632.1 hypothetical protein B1R32_12616 [Abditibacterium utsteinense]
MGASSFLASGAWKVHELQLPIRVEIPSPGLQQNKEDGSFSVKPQKIPVFQQLLTRLTAEAQRNLFASSISVGQATHFPKQSGLDLWFSESLEWNRSKKTLQYTHKNYGWIYGNVGRPGLYVLSHAHLGENPITLPVSVDAQLRDCGWTLTEHYLP